MKKRTIIACFIFVFLAQNIPHIQAVSTNQYIVEMMASVHEYYKYNVGDTYKKGSLMLKDIQMIKEKDQEFILAMAVYQTVQDRLINVTHREIVVFDPIHNEIVTNKPNIVSNNDIVAYKKAHSDQLGTERNHLIIYVFLSFILIVPLFITIIWEKFQYSLNRHSLQNINRFS